MNDNKKIRYVILIWGLVIVSLLIPCVAAAPPQTGHPYMLFHDISETPGYQYRTIAPWDTLEARIIQSADGSLTRDFSGNLGGYDSVMYRGNFARDLGLAYQITKQTKYAIKAKEALLNLTVGATDKMSKANALGGYSLAYDFIQPTLDPATDAIIRDKLATLADTVYKDLNEDGKNLDYISFADYHGQAYPMVGVASAALSDYTNPNNLPLSSTPADWHKVGTDYLFVDDKLHSYGRSLFSFGFDEASGKHLNGAYKSYVIENLAFWFQVSEHAYGENLLEKYPAAKKSVISETWESLPNQYTGNYVTNGNMGSVYHKTIVSLLPDSEKGPVLNHIDRLDAADKSLLLPYSGVYPASPNALIYCVYGNYAAIPRTFPTALNHLDPNSIYQVFRGSWSDDADWLSLVTFNADSRSNRDMMHGDQLSIEYYSRGDLMLADAGENKYVLDGDYGYFDIHHNTIAIEDPRTPFPVSPWSGSASAGIFKGYSMKGIATPVTVGTIVQEPWMQLLQTSAPLTRVMAGAFGSDKTLSSPIQYERTILYPDSDYFVIVDRMEGTEAWTYRNIFRPTSLMVTPTVDANKDGSYSQSEVGHVNGALTIGPTPYDWQALTYKAETKTGITASSLTWTTTNPYGKDVKLNLVSSPASEILIEKNVGRIGGYGAKSEVYNPVVYFRTPAATSEYRVTALLSSYSTEVAKTATEIAVTGTGHAIKVSSSSSDDYIYTGKGTSSFAGFTTDADTVYIRKQGNVNEYTLIQGSFLKEANVSKVNITQKVDLFTLKQEGNIIKFKVKGENSAVIRMDQTLANSVLRDGVVYNDWVMENNSTTLKISTTLSEHDFEISSENHLIINPISNQTVNVNEQLQFPLKVSYTGAGELQSSASNLPKNAAFNTTSRTFSWTPNTNQTGSYTVTFNVTDGQLSDSRNVLIKVNTIINQAPVLEQIGNKTVNAGSTIQFAINATDPDGDTLTYSATGLPVNAMFDPVTRIFSWTPEDNQVGIHPVTFTVSDGSMSDSETSQIRIDSTNHALVLAPIADASVNQKEVLNVQVTASDPDGAVLTYSASNLPVGATFDPVTRQFTWSPAYNQVGNYTVTFRVSDGTLSASRDVTFTAIKVNYAPYFTLGNFTSLTYNEGYPIRVNINAADWNQDLITYSATNLPKGATVDSATHSLSWTPGYDQAGTYNITLIVSDGNLQNSKLLRLIVNDINRGPVLLSLADMTIDEGKLLTVVVNATSSEGKSLIYSATNLPKGATFYPATHSFSWTPAYGQAGSYNVMFTVSDGVLQDSKSVNITVNDSNNALIFEPIANASVNQKEVLNVQVTASDPDGAVLTYSASNLPVGATFDPVTRQFTWSPAYNQVGNYTVTFRVSDGTLSASRDVTFTAIKMNYAPYFTLGNFTSLTYNEGYPIRVNINAADWNHDVITYSATNLPKGATVDSATHSLSWTPGYDQAGTYNITLIVSDGNLQNSKLLRLIVNERNNAPVFGPVADASVNQKEVLNIQVTASDPDGNSLTYSASNLPVGATFDPVTRQFTWSPAYNQVGKYTVTFRVSDGTSSTSRDVTFTAIKVNYAPYFTLGNFTSLTYNEGYPIQVNINAADWNQDIITYSATNLPKGATVDSATHSLSWTPGYDQAGTYNINLIVSDGNLQNSKLLRLIINEVNRGPVLLSLADMTIDEGKLLTVVVNATSSEGKSLIYAATNLPTGATFNSAAHSLAWTPAYDQAGSYTVTFTVSDGVLQDSKSVRIIVNDINTAPTTTKQTPKTYIKLT